MAVNIQTIKRLRQATGVGLSDAKKALEGAGGDYGKALEAMRAKGLASAGKKSDRAARAGIIHSYMHGARIGVLVELGCETEFVAKTEDFKALANDLALHIAASNPTYVGIEDIPADALKKARVKPEDFYAETCLLSQPFVKDPDQTVGDVVKTAMAKLGENIVVRRFVRFELGEPN